MPRYLKIFVVNPGEEEQKTIVSMLTRQEAIVYDVNGKPEFLSNSSCASISNLLGSGPYKEIWVDCRNRRESPSCEGIVSAIHYVERTSKSIETFERESAPQLYERITRILEEELDNTQEMIPRALRAAPLSVM